MAIKLVDELKAMGNFPIAHAEGINLVKTDGTEDNLQNLFDNGELGGGDDSVTLTQQEYEALSEEQKLDGLYYTYDTKRIYKNGIQYGASEPIPLTMEEYKALKEAGAIDEQQEYLIEADEQGILLGAEDIGYNNAESGIQATTVQGAIDKVMDLGGREQSVTFPFTPTANGTLILTIGQKSIDPVARTANVKENGENFYSINNYFGASWGASSASIPLVKGKTYTVEDPDDVIMYEKTKFIY